MKAPTDSASGKGRPVLSFTHGTILLRSQIVGWHKRPKRLPLCPTWQKRAGQMTL
jgi:hypothetical protein